MGIRLLIFAIAVIVFFPLSPWERAGVRGAALAADTRGVTVIAKDPATSQAGEVRLYNKSYAVIIGIDKYKYLPPDRQLKNAVKDAMGVEAVLRKQYRFDRIFSLYDKEATKDRILELLTEELPREVSDQDSVFVFWAGHGNQQKTRDGEMGYLIPHDGNPGKLRTVLTMAELRDTVSKAIPAKHVFYVMDACYGGLLAATRRIDSSPRRDLAYLKEITRERVRQVLTAGGKGEEVLDGGRKGHSVFTGRLIEALEAAGDFVTANEIQSLLKEKVFNDARGRNHTQTPAFGTLYGNGDFVFVPLEQKVDDGSAELERIAKERQALEKQIAELNKSRDADKQRRAREEEEKLKALQELERTKQAQLAREREETEKLKRSQYAFVQKQKQQQEELARKKREEEERLNELKKLAAAAPAGSTGSLEAAVAEIRRLATEIETLEVRFKSEQTEAATRIAERYDTALADVRKQRETEASLPLVKGEFEKESAFRERQKNRFVSYDSRIAELEQQKRDELAQSKQNLDRTLAERTASLRASMQQLSGREFTVDVAGLTLELGAYDAEREQFPVTLTGNSFSAGPLSVKGTAAVAIDKAQRFKGLWQKGIVRPDVRMRAGDGKVIRIALADTSVASDSDSYLMVYDNGEFITLAEKKRREAEAARRKAEQERKREEMKRKLGGFDIEMAPVTGGCFRMGCGSWTDSCYDDEKPVHEVCVSDFAIGTYEVTQGQWKRIMGSNPSSFSSCGDDCPVESVSWKDAQEFIQKLNRQTGVRFRLPTEAEWEYAARSGGREEKYGGGSAPDAVAWYGNNSGRKTHPVGQKQPNGLGIYDMSGNVWEWVNDFYESDYYSWTTSKQDPRGPSEPNNRYRVFRGGGWGGDAGYVRAAVRSSGSTGNRANNLGFRLVAPVQ